MKNYFIISLFIFIGLSGLQAQEKGHYYNFNIGGGYHTLQYDLDNGSHTGGLGYTVNLGYSYFFAPTWGITTGVGIQSFQSEGTLNYMAIFSKVDDDNDAYQFRTDYRDWQEKQSALLLDIPIGISHLMVLNNQWKLRGTVGAKISMALDASYQTTGGDIQTSLYYQRLNAEIFDIDEHSLETRTNVSRC